jgi:hypothetical protein
VCRRGPCRAKGRGCHSHCSSTCYISSCPCRHICTRGRSGGHYSFQHRTTLRQEPEGQALSSFLKTISRLDVMLVQIYNPIADGKDSGKDSESSAFSLSSRHYLTQMLNSARMCFQRLSVAVRMQLAALHGLLSIFLQSKCCSRATSCLLLQMLQENLDMTIDVVCEHHNTPQILVILEALLNHIRSEVLPPQQHPFIRSTHSAASVFECSLCVASHVEFFCICSVSNVGECRIVTSGAQENACPCAHAIF